MGKDLRRYARQTNSRLIIGFLAILLILGIGLIGIFWGKEAAISGILCIGLSIIPIGLVMGLLWVLGWVARKADEG